MRAHLFIPGYRKFTNKCIYAFKHLLLIRIRKQTLHLLFAFCFSICTKKPTWISRNNAHILWGLFFLFFFKRKMLHRSKNRLKNWSYFTNSEIIICKYSIILHNCGTENNFSRADMQPLQLVAQTHADADTTWGGLAAAEMGNAFRKWTANILTSFLGNCWTLASAKDIIKQSIMLLW